MTRLTAAICCFALSGFFAWISSSALSAALNARARATEMGAILMMKQPVPDSDLASFAMFASILLLIIGIVCLIASMLPGKSRSPIGELSSAKASDASPSPINRTGVVYLRDSLGVFLLVLAVCCVVLSDFLFNARSLLGVLPLIAGAYFIISILKLQRKSQPSIEQPDPPQIDRSSSPQSNQRTSSEVQPESSKDIENRSLTPVTDAVEKFAAKGGHFGEVNENYYRQFLKLTQSQIEKLAVAVMLDQEHEVRRLADGCADPPAVHRVAKFVQSVFHSISIGLARFDVFGGLGLVSRIGPKPWEIDMDDALERRYAEIAPMIENIVRRTLPWLLSREISQSQLPL